MLKSLVGLERHNDPIISQAAFKFYKILLAVSILLSETKICNLSACIVKNNAVSNAPNAIG